MPASALAVHDLVRRHPGAARPAVDRLTLDAAPGELLALLGASGSGKTTTLRLVAGYERPDAGAVRLDGVDVTRTPPEHRGVGMVFQHYALFPHLSVEENVAFGLEARGVPRAERRARARAALGGVGLGELHARAVQALSGGEQQRVALARALVLAPRVLLLDEPLSNLDPGLRLGVRDELRATLRREGVTALLVTHDQEDAFAVADRVALLERGRLLQVGAPEAIYDRPASRAAAAFIGQAALLPATLVGATVAGATVAVTVAGVTQRAAARLATSSDAPVGPSGGPPGGGAARLLAVLRPEQLALAGADAEGWEGGDAWPGVVAARRFAGGRVVVRVTLIDGQAVEVATADRRVREGARVRVRLAAAAVAVVADAPPGAPDAPDVPDALADAGDGAASVAPLRHRG